MGTHPIFESVFDCLTECKMGDADHTAYEDAVAEWEAVEQTQHLKINSIGDSDVIQINSHMALQQMHDASYDRVIDVKDISAPVLDSPTDLSCFQQFLRTTIGPEFIRRDPEYDEVMKMILLTKRGLSELNPDFQFQLLSSLFLNLTKQKPSGRFGSHWEEIGFQGNDPGTDLRGAGLFGLWLLIVGSERNDLKMFTESKKYNFPYCTTLLTLCRAASRLLKENQLNSFINQCENIEKVLCDVFQFLHSEFETQWKNLPASSRNVAAAGEITRQIDSNRNKIVQRFSLAPELTDP